MPYLASSVYCLHQTLQIKYEKQMKLYLELHVSCQTVAILVLRQFVAHEYTGTFEVLIPQESSFFMTNTKASVNKSM